MYVDLVIYLYFELYPNKRPLGTTSLTKPEMSIVAKGWLNGFERSRSEIQHLLLLVS